MTYIDLHHRGQHAALPALPGLSGLNGSLVSAAAGATFLLLAAAAAVLTLWLGAGRLLRRLGA
jgi:hypothetical protein